MTAAHRTLGRLVGMLVITVCMALPAYAQTHFIHDVPAAGAPVFQNLATFASPDGAGAGRITFIKLLTNGTGVTFQIQRTPGQAAHVQPGGPSQVISVPAAEDPTQPDVASVAAVAAGGGAPCPATAVAAGYQMVCIIIMYDDVFDFGAGETWQVNVQQHTTSAFEYFGWASTVQPDLTAAEANATAPRIDASAELDFGGVQRGISSVDAPVLAPDVRNVGTAPLSITGGPISSDPAPAFFSTPVFVPTPIDPGASLVNNFGANQGLWVMARPTALGSRTSTLTIQAGTESAPVTLTATGVTLYAHMLMDCSGSMGWLPDGGLTSVETERRLFAAKEAGKEINNWVNEFTGGQGYFGLSTFPQCGGGNVRVPIDRSVNTQGSINTLLGPEGAGGLQATGNTPMQAGIEAAVGDMDARINNAGQQPNAADRPNLRQAILMLSDGYQNSGSDAASTIPSLVSKDIRMFTIGYGVAGSWDVDHALLAQLADETEGESWDPNALNAFELKNAFKNAVRTWLDLEPVIDPTGTIRAGQDRAHTACIDSRAYGVTFVVDWDRPAAGGVGLTLQSSTGEIITPSTPGVAFYGGQTFAQYIIRGNRIRGGAGAGQWTLRLAGGQSIPGNADTNYSYSVMAQTPIRVEPLRRWDLVTGLEHLIEVRLAGWPDEYLDSLVINAHYDAPAQSAGTYLATAEVDRSWFFPQARISAAPSRAASLFAKLVRPLVAQQAQPAQPAQQQDVRVPTMFMGEPATIAQRKAWALANLAEQPFPNERTTGTLQLYDDGTNGDRVASDGIYSAAMPALLHEGIYRYAFEIATAGGPRQPCVNRDVRLSDMVAVQLTPGLIAEHVTWHGSVAAELFFDPEVARAVTATEPPSGFTRTAAVFTPMDEHGNHWGPGRANNVAFAVTNGEAVSPVIDNWDGSYVQVIEHRNDERPAVVITAAGIASSPIELTRGMQISWLWLLLILVLIVIMVLLWKRPWS